MFSEVAEITLVSARLGPVRLPILTPRSNLFPYCQPHNSYNVRPETVVVDQLIIPKLIFFFILITCLLDIVLILKGEILSWSLMGVKGVMSNCCKYKLLEISRLLSHADLHTIEHFIKSHIYQVILIK